MKNKKLFHLLHSLSEKEMDLFGDFLKSPFFNRNKKLVALWELLRPYSSDYEAEKLKDYSFYSEIYDHPPSIEATFRTATLLLKEFLVQTRLRNKPYYKAHLLLEELLKRKNLKEFESILSKNQQQLSALPEKTNLYIEEYYIQFNYLEFLAHTDGKLGTKEVAVKDGLEKLDKFYLVQKFILSSELNNLKRISQAKDYQSELLPEVIEKMRNGWQADNVAINALYLGLLLVDEGDDNDFFALLKLLNIRNNGLSRRQIIDVYTFAANYCIRRIREGEDFHAHLFEIYRATLENHAAKSDTYASYTILKNLTTVGCRLKKYEKTREYLHCYKHLITPDYRDSAFHFNMGLVHYYEGNYDVAIQQFSLAQSYKTIYSIDAQGVLLKIYYLKGEALAFPSLLQAFKVRVSSTKLLGRQRKNGYKNFCKILGPMFKLKTEPNYRKSFKSLRIMMEKYPPGGNTKWVAEQLDELEVVLTS